MSATIYQFPVGGRVALSQRREQEKSASKTPPASAITACGSAWYHEQAIEDADPTRKN